MKNRVLKILSKLILILSIVGIIYSGYRIIKWKKDLNENKTIKSKTTIDISKDEDNNNYNIVNDLMELKLQNEDVVGYISINNTNISYVVVKAKDNDYYLNHNFNKKVNSGGWVFADYNNNLDGTDKNLVIYGHNMKDGSMFGTLRRVLEKDWQNDDSNLTIKLLTLDGIKEYKVFSTYIVDDEDYYITTDFNNDNEYSGFIKKISKRSNHKYDVDLDDTTSILTLSTCTGTNGTKRVVLHAKLELTD